MCLAPLGNSRLYDNQLYSNLHLILFKKLLLKKDKK